LNGYQEYTLKLVHFEEDPRADLAGPACCRPRVPRKVRGGHDPGAQAWASRSGSTSESRRKNGLLCRTSSAVTMGSRVLPPAPIDGRSRSAAHDGPADPSGKS
jgi:hypothetical protein